MPHKDFELVPRLIGKGGQGTARIAYETGAKIRIRGRDSGHKERKCGKEAVEADVPLMVAVSTDRGDETGFKAAVVAVLRELCSVHKKYEVFCRRRGEKAEMSPYSIHRAYDNVVVAAAIEELQEQDQINDLPEDIRNFALCYRHGACRNSGM